jgi:diguanylate cyclase (GGDEF)-like protein
MLDVDHFKRLNDGYGHQRGDECLIQIASTLQSCLSRGGDLAARYGGEEFAVILPATTREGAEAVAMKMKQAVHDLRIQCDPAEQHFMTISVGVATHTFSRAGSVASLIEAADRALYRAKQNGRNRIEFSSPDIVE